MSKIINAGLVRTATERNCLLKTDDLFDAPNGAIFDATYAWDAGHVGYERYLRPGTPIAMITSSGLWVPTKRTKANGAGGAATSLIVDNAAFFRVDDTISIQSKRDTVKLTDSDTAAATGVALYLHMDELGENNFGHLEAVNAGNADSSFTTLSGSVVKVEDDDAAATGGVAVYFDEDAVLGSRLLANVPTGKDAYIFDTAGRAIKITYNATPGTPGVQVYFDDDGAANTRLLFVSPTNASGYEATSSTVGLQSMITKASGLTISAISGNTLTIDAATWADDDEVIASGDLAGAETTRRILHGFVDMYDQELRDYYDATSPETAIAGTFIYSAMLGDIAAILEADKLTNGGPGYLSRIKFDVDTGNA
jgi:hypothetical protein